MLNRLDRQSREAIYRSGLKIFASYALAAWSILGAIFGMPTFLAVFAVWTAITALRRRERFLSQSFNHWDEALWLATIAVGLTILHRQFLA
ncbi:hypothetical protein [Shinella sp. HZN7]|uniref:hypothetical protein n=1 Tax=Shinella sp. (strain HZN7) TaxID=879274 RepID=UPI001FDA86B2|nr:hypothetical protein [Shinella sp. HZN7]